MKKQQVRDALYRELQPLLPGWKLVKKDEAFVRPISGGRQTLGIAIVDYKPEFRFSLVLTTRLDAVENIFNQFNSAPAAYHSLTVTSITQLDYFFADEPPPKQFSVYSEADIVAAVQQLAPLLRDRILPFFDSHRDIAALDAAMNGGDPQFDKSNPVTRNMHALVLARLAGNPRFEQLVSSYEDAMKHFVEAAKQGFPEIVAYLRSLPTK
jgi:hypothetical protein